MSRGLPERREAKNVAGEDRLLNMACLLLADGEIQFWIADPGRRVKAGGRQDEARTLSFVGQWGGSNG
jgi:hypothetical protein